MRKGGYAPFRRSRAGGSLSPCRPTQLARHRSRVMTLARFEPTPSRSGAAQRGPFVDRPRLLSRLTGAETPVVVIEAPAGFGKSTLLGQWRAAAGHPFAALELAAHHNDPVLLVAAIAGAAGEVQPVSDDVYAALHGSRPAVLGVAVPRLQESLARAPGPV